MIILDEKRYSSKANTINHLLEKILTINWYESVGKESEATEVLVGDLLNSLKVSDYSLKWVKEESLEETVNHIKLSGSTVWEKLKDLPEQLKESIEVQGDLKLLEEIVDIVPEVVYHKVFECAYKVFKEEKLVKFFVSQALYFSVLICALKLAGHSNLSEDFIMLLDSGHTLVGPKNDIIYIF